MLKAIVIIVIVLGALIGDLLTLRRSGQVGMPDAEVLKRASKRARDLAAAEKDERDPD